MGWSDRIRGLIGANANGNSVATLQEPISGAIGIENIAIEPKPVPEAPQSKLRGPTVDGREQGVPGTPNLAGFIRDLGEYNPQLDALNGIRTYEKMRRQDPTVAALEAAVRLPIRAAEWSIEPGADKSQPGRALAKEIAAMVEENLFGGLERDTPHGKQTQTFESVIENALLCAPLGVSGSEDLWEIDRDKGQVRLRRIAPRLPITFYQFLTGPDGETLETLIQFGYRGAEVNLFPVPANKLTLFIFNREGANFYGRSMLRPAYQPWYFKSKMMVIDAIGAEKNRLAVPVILQGPNATPDDVTKSWEWAQNLAANERTALSLPYQWEFKQVGIEGRAMSLIDSLRFYDEQIVDAGIAGFLSLGKTATGSRALGDVKMDFFLLSENALAKMIADVITITSIRRLVDFNYKAKPGESLPYPRLVCSNILMVNALDVANAVRDLAQANVGWLETTEERDNFLAQKLGLPPISGTPRPKFAPIVRRIQEMEHGDEMIPDEGRPKAKQEATPKGGAKRNEIDVREPGGKREPESLNSEFFAERPAVYFVRHAHTGLNQDSNPEDEILKGQTDVPPDEKGIRQAERDAENYRDKKIDVVFTSPLARATVLAQAIAKATGAKMHEDADLLPWNYSKLVGMTRREAQPEFDAAAAHPEKNVVGESRNSYLARWRRGAQRAVRQAEREGKNVVVVTHSPNLKDLDEVLGLPQSGEGMPETGGGIRVELAERQRRWEPRNDFERHVNQAALRERENKTQRVVARLMRRAKPALIAQAAHQASTLAATQLGHLAVSFDYDLAAAIERALERACDFGEQSIERERRSQKSQANYRQPPIGNAEILRLAQNDGTKKGLPTGGKKGGPTKNRLLNAQLIAQMAVADLNNWINGRAAGAAVDLTKDGLSDDDLEGGVSDALHSASDGAIDRAAAEAARQAVAAGRMRAMDRYQDEIEQIVRREVMDANTCEPCAAGDGTTWGSWDEVDWHPGDDCEGGDACRGDLIAEFRTGITQ